MSVRRVLIVRVGAMGDLLHGLPAVAALRQAWPEAVIDWVVDPRWAPLLVGAGGRGPVASGVQLAETRLWSSAPFSGATVRSLLGLRRGLEAGRYRGVMDLQGTLRSAVIGRMAGSGEAAGFSSPREWPARLLYTRTFQRRGTHVVEQNTALLGEALGLRLQPEAVELPRWEAAEDWAERSFGGAGVWDRTALLAPSAGWAAKQWPAERFGALARALKAMGFAVLVNAADVDDAVGTEVVRTSGNEAKIVPCHVAELVALTRRVALVVGGDSGPVHLAAALGRPLVALYGPTDPARNGPWGAGLKRVLRDPASVTSHKRVREVEAGLARISLAEVVGAVEAVLAER